MRPLAVLNAILFGSAAAITFGLCAVLVIYLVLQGRHPQLATEFGPLLRSSGMFAALSIVSGLSLYSSLKELNWRWAAQIAMWVAVALTVAFYWPR
ncbi:hypothetical protein HNQ60_001176 [Povalibacter uvarum]|uniref:Uncharacterized protein n=1 Tax=Povalibacter uvarum TaxID=732238 RepID=A0A841HJ50_9GAMM|nr:hypothetical protein [Povalibacter uvarum]MBB6092330.1 hypothetical protein [Povalibacter uvarum]